MHFDDKSGRLRPNIELNLECFSHWRNSGRLSDCNLGILYMRLYGDIWSGDSWSMVKRRCKCLVVTYPIGSYVSAVT